MLYIWINVNMYKYIYFVKLSTLLIKKGSHKWYATLTTLAVVWAVLVRSQKAKQLLYTDWSYITLLNFVKLSTLLIKKGSHRRYATLTTLAVVWALWSFMIFFWSELYWWALKEWNSFCIQIDRICINIYYWSILLLLLLTLKV